MRRTSDTSLVRDYCNANIGGVLDLNYVSKNFFSDIPEVNLRKIATRLIDSGLLRQISKGVYLIGDSDLSDEERIINHYLYDGTLRVGVPVGEYLMYTLGFEDEEPLIKQIKTKRTVGNKNIGNIQIIHTNTDIGSGKLNTYELEIALELIEKMDVIHPFKINEAQELVEKYLKEYYADFRFSRLEMDRPRKTYLKLAYFLNSMDICNRVEEIYAEKTRF